AHPSLRQPAGAVTDPVAAYAAHRASPVGGGHDTLIITTDELYDHFSYGEETPLAIRNLVRALYDPVRPRFVFLVGKGVEITQRRRGGYDDLHLVPTYGAPVSDAIYGMGLVDTSYYTPGVQVGRLAARNAQQVVDYLDKVIEHDQLPYDVLWRKRALMLSGGITSSELRVFRTYVEAYASTAARPLFGAETIVRSKSTSNVIDTINVVPDVNQGVSIMTAFGHASPNGGDIDFGYASSPVLNYRNEGRYPLLVMNGCFSGNIFTLGGATISEDWVLTPDKGSIGFLAHVFLGLPFQLHRFTEAFYQTAFADSAYWGAPLGIMRREVTRRYVDGQDFLSIGDQTTLEQLCLHGDPALRLFGPDRPDYALDESSLFLRSFDGGLVTAATDSFQIGVVARNYGRAVVDTLQVGARRRVGGREQELPARTYDAPWREDTLFFTVVNGGDLVAGNNQIEITLDAPDAIAELDEANNSAVLEVFLPAGSVSGLFPNNYGIVSEAPARLMALSADVRAQERGFVFESDTVPTFDSPRRRRSPVIRAMRTVDWELPIESVPDSTVIYWRVRYAEVIDPQDTIWSTRSFTWIPGSPEGWTQRHPGQWRENEQRQVRLDPITDRWRFDEVSLNVSVQVVGDKVPNRRALTQLSIGTAPQLNLNLAVGPRSDNSSANIGNIISAVVFDQNTLRPYLAPLSRPLPLTWHRYGRNPGVITYFANRNNINLTTGVEVDLAPYLDTIAEGDYVLLFTEGTVNYNDNNSPFNEEVRAALAGIGVDLANFSNLQTGEPWIVLGRKGADPGEAIEVYAKTDSVLDGELVPADSQQISRTFRLVGQFAEGSVTSPRVGPARTWGDLRYSVATPDASDAFELELYGESLEGEQTLLQTNPPVPFVLDEVSAETYPYLRLRVWLRDSVAKTPPRPEQWLVRYEAAPEGIILADGTDDVPDVPEGEPVTFRFAFENISQQNFVDSLPVELRLLNVESNTTTTERRRVAPLAAGDTARLSYTVDTRGRRGENRLQVFFNPYEVPEQYYENNALEVSFGVVPDRTPPVLDVAFDGRRILDGEIVSPTPVITVRLKDENTFLIREDPEGIRLFLRAPDAPEFQAIETTDPRLTWTPAGESNDFRLTYRPDALPDGIYTLRVQGNDVSGNPAGRAYEISFEVINASTITHFYPYPNPFTTHTRFVFTLTGRRVPDNFKVQIMTISGKVVREIFKEELGMLRIGNNVTDFTWDGTDAYGDRLANGVYLYRVVMSDADGDFEHRATAADRAFKRGWGKLYILR
ncbi:MAG: C25 family cysteine peptidase, partial [Catalinimonas sp.]